MWRGGRGFGVNQLRAEQLEVRRTLQEMAGTGERDTEAYRKTEELEQELDSLLRQHCLGLLKIGAAGRLYLSGELGEVLPLEDEQVFERARPSAMPNPAANEAREDAQVRAALAHGLFAFIVLGGGHDLTDNVNRLAGSDCEYLRVSTKWYKAFSGAHR